MLDNFTCYLTFVYAAMSYIDRKILWQELISLSSSCSCPWLLVGDFNIILGAHERHGGDLPLGAGTLSLGLRPFKFHPVWLEHSSFKDIVLSCWNSSHFYGCPMNKLSVIQSAVSSTGGSEKARTKWLSDRDRCLKFFNAFCKAKVARSSLNSLCIDGSLTTNPVLISDHIVAYYQNLYTSSGTSSDFAEICSVIPNIVSQEENTSLTAIPKANEIKATVFSMDSHSAPGPDGFSGSFYQSCWDIIGADVVNSVQQFFSQGYLLPNLNSNFIVLIPKEPGANEISKFGPIGLENFIFKIILKILANRLGKFITRILSPQQTAFIKGRSIVESIGMVSENVNLLDRKNLGGNLGLKLDIKKTFDSLEWNFLLHVLRCFGFSETFIKWVHTLLHSTKLSILINGCPCGFFSCSRGVRQGDPLSPLLVCLAKDVLSRGCCDRRHLVTVSWPTVCSLKNKGRLGLRDFNHLNFTALLKTAWNIFSYSSPWSIFFKGHFNFSLGSMSSTHKSSSIWSGLKLVIPKLFQSCKWIIGSGDSVNLWLDKRLLAPIASTFPINIHAPHLKSKVSSLIAANSWSIPEAFQQYFPTLTTQILAVPLPLEPVDDVLIWEHSSNGMLTLTNCYKSFLGESSIYQWNAALWSKYIAPNFPS
ncbi:hypothetical protein KPL70_002710 [Citrus sinensis]|nr:hypothetical protein KPL70_002710 [Citrus sinensis]